MKKITALFMCAAVLLSALPALPANTGAIKTSGSNYYSWYLEPSVIADDMTVLYNYQGGFDPKDSSYFYDTIDRMHLGKYTPFEADGKWGLIDYKGNVALTPRYDKIAASADSNGFVGLTRKVIGDRVLYTDETTLVEKDGKFEAEPFYDGMLGTNGKIQRAFYWIPEEEKAYVGGVQAYAGDYDISDLTFCAQIGALKDAGIPYVTSKSGSIINTESPDVVLVSNGKRVNGEYYTDGGCFSEGLIAVCKEGAWGYINEKGETVIPFELDAVSTIDYSYSMGLCREMVYEASNGYVSVSMGGACALYDTRGNKVIEYEVFDKILPVFSDGKRDLAWVKTNGAWGVIRIGDEIEEDPSDTDTETDDPKSSDTETGDPEKPDTDTGDPEKSDTDTDTSTTSKYRKGDVNRDRYITAKDSLLASRHAVGLIKLDEEQFALGDIDGDGRVTNKDALYILRFTIGYKIKGM